MKILIVSYELWDGVTNGGNVLSSIFEGYDAEFAQIFCVSGTPYNKTCKKYFQISDQMIMYRKEIGKELSFEDYPANIEGANPRGSERKTITYFRSSLMLLREMAWFLSKWKTKELERFVRDFNPDIIFAPCNPIPHVLKLQKYVKSIAKCPMVSYVYDDIYSLKKFSLSPVFWLNHFHNRKHIRRIFKDYDYVFTMTDKQKNEYEKHFNRPMGILCKCGRFDKDVDEKREICYPVKIIYAGGVYINRWKILKKVKNALCKINQNGKLAELHIYTANKVSEKQKKAMADNESSFLHSAVGSEELKEIYKSFHIALHVESFDIVNRLNTRLSFSTKIVDCLESGCAVVAIAPKGQAGMEYLKENGAALCINSKKNIENELRRIIEKTGLIEEYSISAIKLGKDKHKREHISSTLKKTFDGLLKTGE